jgi:mannosyltransferase
VPGARRPDDRPTSLIPRLDPLTTPEPPSTDSVNETRLLGVIGVATLEEGGSAQGRALEHLAWLACAILAGGVALVRINWPSLWADELSTWDMVTTSWSQLVGGLQHHEATFGPYYAFMHLWVSAFGDSDTVLRLPSVLAMAGTAGLTARIGTRLGTPRVGLLAGLLFAVLPATSRYAQEVRPYALVMFAATLSTLMLLRALERPRFWPLAGYALSVGLLGSLHVAALLLIPAHCLAVLAVRRAAMLRWMVAAAVGALPALPILYLSSQQADQASGIGPQTVSQLANYPEALFGTAIVAGMLLIMGLFSVSARYPAVFYTSWALAPVVLLFLASKVTPLWLPQYLLFTIPAWALLAATALQRTRLVRGIVIFALVAAVGISAQAAIREPAGHQQATKEAADLIATKMAPGDAIVYNAHDGGADVYGVSSRVGRDLVAHYVPASRRPADALQLVPERTNGLGVVAECADAAKCLAGKKRLWILRLGKQSDPVNGLDGTKTTAIRNLYYVSQTWYPHGFTVALLLPKPTA